MNNTVGNILNFFADTSKSLGARVGTVIISIALLFSVDTLTGLTYNFQTNNRLNQLEKISELKKIYSQDNNKLQAIQATENQILKRRHYSEIISSWFNSRTRKMEGDVNLSNHDNESILDIKLMVLSSSYSLIIFSSILFLLPFFSYGNERFDKSVLMGWIVGIIFFFTAITVLTALSYLIPVIDNEKPYYNYLINFGVHSLFLLFFIFIFKK